jgi:hypothetical protein
MNQNQLPPRPAILDEFRQPQTPEEILAKEKQFEMRYREFSEAENWIKGKIAALKQEYAEQRPAMREELLDGTGHNAALRRLAIREEFEEWQSLLKELHDAQHPERVRSDIQRCDVERRLSDQSRKVAVGDGRTSYGRVG